MKIIFMGTPEFAVPSLNKLIEAGHEILAVFTQPDKPVGRKQILTLPPVKVTALNYGLNVIQPVKIKNARDEFESLFKQADIGIVAAYGRILPDWMLAAPKYGCLNVHSSLLPKYRGAAPINWAIVNGETITGLTIMQMDTGLDTGDMLLQRSTSIGDEETTSELTPRLAEIGASALLETVDLLLKGELKPTPQNNDDATYAPILKREDGLVNWKSTAQQIFNKYRGFNPFPGCHTLLNGQKLELVKIKAEQESQPLPVESGIVCEIGKDFFAVGCGDNTKLMIYEVQLAGKRVMSVRDFLNGLNLAVGSAL